MERVTFKAGEPMGPSIKHMLKELNEEETARANDCPQPAAPVAASPQPVAATPVSATPASVSATPAPLRLLPRDSSLKTLQQLYGLPERLDPFSATLLAGVDPVAVHQALTLSVPILSFLAQNMRVKYGDGQRRWICGQSWQMGASGCGKSLVLRSLEELFLAKEIEDNRRAAEEAAAYSMLSEKERRERPMPETPVRVIDGVPTAVALLMQLQINKGEGVYITCSECGEMSKKIRNNYYSLVLDMFKNTYYVHSMKICANVGGTVDPMMKIFKWVNKDGTLSRGNLTILPERKDEKRDGVYRAPAWSEEQRATLTAAAERLRRFDNSDPADECVTDGRIIALGRRVKQDITALGERADDCCSRADERAMGLAYLLCAANGCIVCSGEGQVGTLHSPEADATVEACIEVARWWIMQSINAAMAMQERLDYGTKSQKEAFALAYKTVSLKSLAEKVKDAREEAFRSFETKYEGQHKRAEDFREMPALRELSDRSLRRAVSERNYESLKRGFYLITRKEAA